jgi:hypothetical protein
MGSQKELLLVFERGIEMVDMLDRLKVCRSNLTRDLLLVSLLVFLLDHGRGLVKDYVKVTTSELHWAKEMEHERESLWG